MACKLQCPQCKKILKCLGEGENKQAQGEYRVYESYYPTKGPRLILCYECFHVSEVSNFSKY